MGHQRVAPANPRAVAASERLYQFFNSTAKQLAHATHFVQRTSKLTGSLFAQIWVLGLAVHPQASLNQFVAQADDLGLAISEQALDQRLTPAAIEFLRELLGAALQLFRNDLALHIPWLQHFTAIYFQDSSFVALPETMQAEFPGCAGDGPSAGLKVQLLFEWLHGNLETLVLQSGRAADQAYDAYIAHLQAGALILQDLGFFAVERLRRIDAQKTYFLSRFDTQTAVFDPMTSVRWDLLDRLRGESRALFECEAQVGVEVHLLCRLVFVRLPTAVANERRRKAKRAATRRGQGLSVRALALMDWNIYLTNVPTEWLPTEQVALLYSVRWQVELIFKLWKSELALSATAGRRERILCDLYARLIGAVLLHWLIAPLRLGERELSLTKAAHLWRRQASRVAEAITAVSRLAAWMDQLLERMTRHATKNKRQKDPSTLQQLQAVSLP